MYFLVEVCDQLFDDAVVVFKTTYIIQFLSERCSKSLFSNGADGYNRSVF